MNSIMMQAFYDELEKIADWSLAGPALAQHSAESLAAGGPHGTFTSPQQLQQVMREKEMTLGAGQRAAQMREAKMEQMLQSGQWNPSTHTVDAQGNLTPRKPVTAPTRSIPRTEAVTKVERMGPSGTALIRPSAAAPARAAAPSMAQKAVRGVRGAAGKVRGGRLGLGLGALGLGLGGLGGFGMAQPAAAAG